MTDAVVPLRFNVQEVGKHVKSSKKRFTWEVSINGRQHSIVLDFSFISGKVKVTVDRKILLQNELPANTSFQYPFTLDGNSLNVIQQGESFELRINNKVFSHLYNQAKTNKQFKKYEDEIKDFKVNENQFQAKKLTLNIGGTGGGMKKKAKNQSSQGHNWNAFGEDEMGGFPNYFQGQSVSTSSSSKIEQSSVSTNTKKSSSLLDQDSIINNSQKQQKKIQNILDFETELNTSTPPAVVSVNQPIKPNDQFSTMQMMFQTMNLNSSQQQQRNQVVIDSSEVDFFSLDEKPSKPIQSQSLPQPQSQPQIDFFLNTNSQQTQKIQPVIQPKTTDYNTMQYMFATNQGITNNINQSGFNTSAQNNQQNDKNWNTQSINFGITTSPSNMQSGFNLNNSSSSPTVNNTFSINNGVSTGFNSNVNGNTQFNFLKQPQPHKSDFSILQGLFSTNAINPVQNTSTVKTSVIQQQINFSSNPQYFATQNQQSQSFGTSIGLNVNQFGTQNLSTQQQPFQFQINSLQTKSQQPVTLSSPVQQSNQINSADFNSMQMLFKTNNVQQTGFKFEEQSVPQQNPQKSQSEFFNQQFATIGGASTQSPNMMFMNTYGGSNNNQPNLSFDFGGQTNPSMMKKKTVDAPVVQQNGNAADLL